METIVTIIIVRTGSKTLNITPAHYRDMATTPGDSAMPTISNESPQSHKVIKPITTTRTKAIIATPTAKDNRIKVKIIMCNVQGINTNQAPVHFSIIWTTWKLRGMILT